MKIYDSRVSTRNAEGSSEVRSGRQEGTSPGTQGERKSNEDKAYNDALKKKQSEAAIIDLRLSQAETPKEKAAAESDKVDFEKAIGMTIGQVLSQPFR